VGRRRAAGCFRRRDRHPDRRGPFVARRAGPRRSCGGGTGLDHSGADHLQLVACWARGLVAVGGPRLFALGKPGSLVVGGLWQPHPGGAAGPVRVLLSESVGTSVRSSKLLGAIAEQVRIVAVAEQVRIVVAVAKQVAIAVALGVAFAVAIALSVAFAFAVAIALSVAFAFAFEVGLGLGLALAVVCLALAVVCLGLAVGGCLFVFAVGGRLFVVIGTLFTVRESQRVDEFRLSLLVVGIRTYRARVAVRPTRCRKQRAGPGRISPRWPTKGSARVG
jgi:hypothetical protein